MTSDLVSFPDREISVNEPRDRGRYADFLEQQYGGALQYLCSIGIDDGQQNEIREALLEQR